MEFKEVLVCRAFVNGDILIQENISSLLVIDGTAHFLLHPGGKVISPAKQTMPIDFHQHLPSSPKQVGFHNSVFWCYVTLQ